MRKNLSLSQVADMKKQRHKRTLGTTKPWWFFLLVLALLWGCQSQEPPLSPKAAAFAQAVREVISRFAPVLVGPVSQRDIPAIQAELERFYSGEKHDGKLALLRLTILDNSGVVIANYPPDTTIGDDFSKYTAFAQALQNKCLAQEKLYGPDGDELYAVYAPLLDRDKIVGEVRFLLDAEKVKDKWGVTTEEFLSIDFSSRKITP
jgi:hypothetical protein